MDGKLRALERLAEAGDIDARMRLLGERVRIGEFPRHKIDWAAHLGHPVGLSISGSNPEILVTCEHRSFRRRGIRQRTCLACGGRGLRQVTAGLIPFVREVYLPLPLVIEWVLDCWDHILPKEPDHFLGPNYARFLEIDRCARRWLESEFIDIALREVAGLQDRDPAVAIARACVRFHITQEHTQLRRGLAEAASAAYHHAGNTRAYREWQSLRLAELCLRD